MPDPKEKGKNEPTDTPPEVQEKVERHIHEHIIKHEPPAKPAGPPAKPVAKSNEPTDETEVEKLRSELDEVREELEKRADITPEDLEKLQGKHDDLQGKLKTIALKEFEAEKQKRVEVVEKRFGKDSDQAKKVAEMIKDPEDLVKVDAMVDWLETQLKESQEEKSKETGKPAAVKPTDGTPEKPPKSSVASLPPAGAKTFASAKEMVDDVYTRMAKGDPEATAIVNKWRAKLRDYIKKHRDEHLGIQGCPRCKAGIKEGEACPYCGWGSEEGDATLQLEKIGTKR